MKRTTETRLLVMIRLISTTICLLMGCGLTIPPTDMSGFRELPDTVGGRIRMETGYGPILVGPGSRIGIGVGFPFTTADGAGTII